MTNYKRYNPEEWSFLPKNNILRFYDTGVYVWDYGLWSGMFYRPDRWVVCGEAFTDEVQMVAIVFGECKVKEFPNINIVGHVLEGNIFDD